jgi:hypothetical protein
MPCHPLQSIHTVKPFGRVVVSVFTPFFVTGVANPLLSPDTTLGAARLRRPCARFKANRRDAMESLYEGGGEEYIGLKWPRCSQIARIS